MDSNAATVPPPMRRKRRLPPLLVTTMRTLLLTWLIAAFSLFFFQHKLVWYPAPPPTQTPASFRLPYRDLDLVTSDGVALDAWWIEADAPHGVVLHLHGNAGSIGNRLSIARALRRIGWSTLLLDYRGYGHSEGTPSEEGTYRDAEAAYDALRNGGVAAERIVAWGESLGGGVAIELARRRPLAGVVTEATFTSIPDVGAARFPFLPVRLLARVHYDNFSKVGELTQPLLLMHGRSDDLVPFAQGERLFARAQAARAAQPSAAPLHFLPLDSGHEAVRFGSDVAASATIERFLLACVAPR